MGLKVTGECKVYNLKQGEKSVKAGLGLNSKDNQGQWKTEFIQGMFVKEAFEPATRLEPKDKISITSSSLSVNTVEKDGRKTTYYSVVIFEFENLTNPVGNSEGGFHEASEEESGDLPF
jgi:hypothetical protein